MGFIIYWQKCSYILWFVWNWLYSTRGIKKIKDKSITDIIFRIQDNESIMCGFYWIVFIEYMLAGKTLLDCTNLLSPNDYKKNDKLIHNIFKDKYGRRIKSRV